MSEHFIELCNRLSDPWASWMGTAIAETAIVLAIVSGIWCLLRKHSSPQLGYLLFLLVPLRLLIPLEIHLPGVWAHWNPVASNSAEAVAQTSTPSAFADNPHYDVSSDFNQSDRNEAALPAMASESLTSRNSTRASHRLTLTSWLMLAWSAGFIFLIASFCVAQGKLLSLLRRAAEIDPDSLALDMAELCRRAGVKQVRILESERIPTPSLAGLFRPSILLPAGLLETLSVSQREWVLLHELAHVRRRDLAVNCVQRIATIVFFPNPALWLANRQIDRLREFACDDLASALSRASQIESSEAFLSVMKHARQRRSLLSSAVTLGMSRSGSQSACLARMNRILNADLSQTTKFGWKSLTLVLLSAAIFLPHLRAQEEQPPASVALTNQPRQPAESAKKADPKTGPAKEADADQSPVHISVVVAEHVVLLDGKSITTWEELEKKIAALPDPSLAYPHFYITGGAMAAGKFERDKEKIWQLHQKFQLKGHSQGSLWQRTDLRYDRIKTEDDLKPDPALRKTGTVIADGKPVSGVEVILITPIDESILYKTYEIALVEGRVRNRLEHVMTVSDEQGQFTLFPPKDTPYYILALHPESGFALVSDEQIQADGKLRLRKWGGIVARLDDPKKEQQANLTTRIKADDGRPEISINQYWSDLNRKDDTRVFEFSHVPTINDTAISRSFPGPGGASTSLPAASVSLLPGETRRIDFGEATPEQLEYLRDIREMFDERRRTKPEE